MKNNKELCEFALSYVGKVKYVFGANDIAHGRGDCSAFTQFVYNHFGLSIGRDTESQYSITNPIQDKDAVAGDLIFFKNTYNSGHTDGVSHVGIYLGNNKFVHNSTSYGISVSELSGYYTEHFLGFRRVSGLTKDTEKVDADTTANKTNNSSTKTTESKIGLKWWGDIVRVVVILIIMIIALVYFGASVGLNVQAGIFKIKGGR